MICARETVVSGRPIPPLVGDFAFVCKFMGSQPTVFAAAPVLGPTATFASVFQNPHPIKLDDTSQELGRKV